MKTKQINAALATENVLVSIKGSLLVDFKDIVDTDHRGFIIDLDVKQYFDVDASKHNANDNVLLDLTRQSHKVKL